MIQGTIASRITKRIWLITLLSTGSVLAQETVLIAPVVPRSWEQIRQYLVLSEAQVSALDKIRQDRLQEEQAVYRQVAEKQQQMYGLLQQGSNDALIIGRLMVDINNLQRQLPLKSGPYRTQVLAVLTPEQKTKLQPLLDALSLQTAAWQAIELNMIDNPHVPDVRVLPMPLDTISATTPGNGTDVAKNVR